MADFFGRSLATFASSGSPLQVVCTLPQRGDEAAARPPRSDQATRKLIVLDSSFNPPTVAHARMAASAVRAAGPDARLMLLLAVHNADKKPKPAGFSARLAMMDRLARGLLPLCRGLDQLDGREPEIDLAVTTRALFIDKWRAMTDSEFYRAAPPVETVFLVGFDTLTRIMDPKYYLAEAGGSSGVEAMSAALGPFFQRARLLVTTRWGGAAGDETTKQARQGDAEERQRAVVRGYNELVGTWAVAAADASAPRIQVAVVEGNDMGDVSSSRVREAVASSTGGWEQLVMPEVGDYIEREKLYVDDGSEQE